MNNSQNKKPKAPLPHECCGGGACCPCVWDTYYKAMRAWQAQQGQTPTIDKPRAGPDRSNYR